MTTTTKMTVPTTMPFGTYALRVTANGIASLPYTFWNPNPNCIADLNLDGKVDGADLAVVLVAWGTPGSTTGGGDLNGDGRVNGEDLGILLAAWGNCPV